MLRQSPVFIDLGWRKRAIKALKRTMRRPHLLSVLVLFAVMVAGCARQPYPTGYLEDYDGLVNQPDPMRSVFAE
ncbi:hypothetical protein FJY63_14560, partial [Candidatus Sumerlaeota bacterium]|nr:hypothetical protein [Candidatus Sumerlaeota bacterium]